MVVSTIERQFTIEQLNNYLSLSVIYDKNDDEKILNCPKCEYFEIRNKDDTCCFV